MGLVGRGHPATPKPRLGTLCRSCAKSFPIGRVVITAPYDKSCSKSHHGICKYVPGTVKTVSYRLFLGLWQMICVPPRRDEGIPPYR